MKFSTPLGAFSALYGAGIGIRNVLWDRAFLRPTRMPVPVISVGNLSLGGTGKTPTVAQICSLLRLSNHMPGILTRGYGRKSTRNIILTGREKTVSWVDVGDEPAMLFRRLGCPMGIGANRAAMAEKLLAQTAVDCLVLDDGLQHRRLHRDLDLVVINAALPPWRDRLMPAGLLREPLSALGRAHGVVVKGENAAQRSETVARLAVLYPGLPVFEAEIRPAGVRPIGTEGILPLSTLSGQKIALFAAIADPGRFEMVLEEEGVHPVARHWFRDHHIFRRGELDKMFLEFQRKGAQLALTTEKDAARLEGLTGGGTPVFVLDVEMVIFGKEAFIEWLGRAWKN